MWNRSIRAKDGTLTSSTTASQSADYNNWTGIFVSHTFPKSSKLKS